MFSMQRRPALERRQRSGPPTTPPRGSNTRNGGLLVARARPIPSRLSTSPGSEREPHAAPRCRTAPSGENDGRPNACGLYPDGDVRRETSLLRRAPRDAVGAQPQEANARAQTAACAPSPHSWRYGGPAATNYTRRFWAGQPRESRFPRQSAHAQPLAAAAPPAPTPGSLTRIPQQAARATDQARGAAEGMMGGRGACRAA